MANIKINIDSPEISSEKIAQRKDFGALTKKFKATRVSFYKKNWFSLSVAVIILAGTYLAYYEYNDKGISSSVEIKDIILKTNSEVKSQTAFGKKAQDAIVTKEITASVIKQPVQNIAAHTIEKPITSPMEETVASQAAPASLKKQNLSDEENASKNGDPDDTSQKGSNTNETIIPAYYGKNKKVSTSNRSENKLNENTIPNSDSIAGRNDEAINEETPITETQINEPSAIASSGNSDSANNTSKDSTMVLATSVSDSIMETNSSVKNNAWRNTSHKYKWFVGIAPGYELLYNTYMGFSTYYGSNYLHNVNHFAGVNVGIQGGYNLSKRWTLRGKIIYSSSNLTGHTSYDDNTHVTPSTTYSWYGITGHNTHTYFGSTGATDGNSDIYSYDYSFSYKMKVYQIPLLINYYFIKNDRRISLYASTGISAIIDRSKKYIEGTYTVPLGGFYGVYEINKENGIWPKYKGVNIPLSIGTSFHVNKRFFISLEPYAILGSYYSNKGVNLSFNYKFY